MYDLGLPIYYDYQNVHDSLISPSTIHVHDNALSRYFKRYLLMKTIAVFEWKLPKTWDYDYFLYNLYCRGFVCVINTDKYGVIPQHCSLSGYGIYYQPTRAIVSNPLLKGLRDLQIGTQTELIKLNHDYGSVLDLINYYGDLLALAGETSGTNLLNCKLAYLFAVPNKGVAETVKKLYDKVASGEPMGVFDKALLDENGKLNIQMFNQNLSQTYICDKVLADMRKLEDEFLTMIGIPNANTDKRERLITDEVNSNNVETKCLASQWLENLKLDIEKVNKMFGLDLSVDWRFKNEMKEGEKDEVNTKSNRNLSI